MRQAGEPSVEEILESIKKVIARDNRGESGEEHPAKSARNATERGGADDEPADDAILDLAETGAMVSIDELELDDECDGAEPEAALLDEGTRISMRDSLAALAMLSQPGAQPQIVRSGETSLEGLTRELLRPMLAEWLDKHLPGMVERMVKDEIARIAGKRG
jgi:uncharacterized protein